MLKNKILFSTFDQKSPTLGQNLIKVFDGYKINALQKIAYV